MKINDLKNVTLQIEMTRTLTFRLIMFMVIMRLACWVGSVELEFFQPEE